jgi:hypothetical protein
MVTQDNADSLAHQSYLFMLRVWIESLADGQIDWRGKIQYVNSGEVHYFRDWKTFENYVNGWISKACQPADEDTDRKP